ncbi:MAG: hypothetical protein Q8P56_00225 [Candidatus Uhrbacteria bacterium]|nr:hypothetical protein [Candidatus Uhrbacteria bacterium]
MNFDNPTPSPEKEPHSPSLEEIRYRINSFVEKSGQKNAREIRVLAQGETVYHYELATTDKRGDDYLYLYKRKGLYPDSQALTTTVEVTYFIGSLQTNIACGGDTLSNYDENSGRWIDIK